MSVRNFDTNTERTASFFDATTFFYGWKNSEALPADKDFKITYNNLFAAIRGGFTAGSVVFAGAGGALDQDNANLFWDNTLNFLGIGTASPAGSIDIRQVSTAPAIRVVGTTTGGTVPAIQLRNAVSSFGIDINLVTNSINSLLYLPAQSDTGNTKGIVITGNTGATAPVTDFQLSIRRGGTGARGASRALAITSVNTFASSESVMRNQTEVALFYNNTTKFYNSQLARISAVDGVLHNIEGYRGSGSGVVDTAYFWSKNGQYIFSPSVAPSVGIADAFAFYSADITPGNAAPHFRTEVGNIIKLYRETTAVSAGAFVANTSGILNDTATFGGYTIGQIVNALKNFGLLQ